MRKSWFRLIEKAVKQRSNTIKPKRIRPKGGVEKAINSRCNAELLPALS